MSRRLATVIAVVLSAGLVLAACGDDSDSEGGSGNNGGDGSYTVGFSNPAGRSTFISTIDDALRAYVEEQGSSYKSLDADLDVNKQVADIDQLVAEDVDAIAFVAIDERAVRPALERAQDAGIRVFSYLYELNYDGAPPSAPVDGQVLDDRNQMAEEQAAYVNEALGGQGGLVYIDFAAPVSGVRYLRDQFATDVEEYPGLELLETVSNPTDDTAGARPPADAMLAKYPDLNAFVAFNDPTAIGAYEAAESAGKAGEIVITGAQLQPEGVEALESGKIDATWDSKPVELAQALSEMMFAALDGDPEADWKVTVIIPPTFYDQANIGEFVPWEEQIEAIG